MDLMFNHGFWCNECGPVKESKQRSINKVKHQCCKECGNIVKPWERPLNERAGRCFNCGHGAFTLAMHKGQLLRCCKKCEMVINPDTNEVIREGKK